MPGFRHHGTEDIYLSWQEEDSEGDDDNDNLEGQERPSSTKAVESTSPAKDNDGISEAIRAVEESATLQLMQDTLDIYYVPLETWYTRTIIDKVCDAFTSCH